MWRLLRQDHAQNFAPDLTQGSLSRAALSQYLEEKQAGPIHIFDDLLLLCYLLIQRVHSLLVSELICIFLLLEFKVLSALFFSRLGCLFAFSAAQGDTWVTLPRLRMIVRAE